MSERAPHVVILAGPNGAGKSTAAPSLLRGRLRVSEFVNADTIARGLAGFAPDTAAFDAGRIMLRRLRELVAERRSFAFETTLASRTFAPRLVEWRGAGYRAHLVFLWLPDADLAIARVGERVRAGGHDVPRETIVRRYARGAKNFLDLYRPLVDTWRVLDNSLGTPRLIARARQGSGESIQDVDRWTRFQEAAQ